MRCCEAHILPHLIDPACSNRPARKQRAKVVPLANGLVLEVGFGSGPNLPFHVTGKVRKICGLEPWRGIRRKARPMVAASPRDVEFIDLPDEGISLPDESIDTVLVTCTRCAVPDPRAGPSPACARCRTGVFRAGSPG